MKPYDKAHVPLAKRLRKQMTPEERKIWYLFLAKYPIRFRRQVSLGAYIVDFYCPKAKLVVELDGTQHFLEDELQKDEQRTRQLEELGLRVVRFSNRQINREFEGVCRFIDQIIKQS